MDQMVFFNFHSIAMITLPAGLVLKQPDLGTAALLSLAGGTMLILAGIPLWMLGLGFALVLGAMPIAWQFLHDYQRQRVFTFLDPESDPLGSGYHILQSKIALGSGGLTGKGYMQGTQSRLNFLPEKHTDFIFTTLAEEFGFIGGVSLLTLYGLIVGFCFASALSNKDRFASLLTYGIATTFFLFFAVNMGMVMGLMPVVGVPLPLVSYGGTAMIIILSAFGLVQSAHIHRPR